MATNSSPIIFEAYSTNVRSASFHHHPARVHPQPSFHSQRGTPSTSSSPICRHAQVVNNHSNGHYFYNQLKNHHKTHSQNASVTNSSTGSSPRLVERCVIVARQPDGYGLTVSGEHPVFVDSVKVGGAAAKAGVRENDQIVKINGMPVSSSNHFEVLRMISDGPNVALTLLGEPLSCDTCRPIFFESGFFEEPRKYPNESDKNKSPTETEAINADELDLEDKVEPVRNWVNSGGKHYAAPSTITNASSTRDLTRTHVESDDEPDDVDVAAIDGGPDEPNTGGQRNTGFVCATQLKRNPAELALFINFAVHHSDPTSALFYLITDLYQASGAQLKELRRFAYEIFSTFLIPNAPLQVMGITQVQIQSIDRILAATANSNFHEMDQLKKIFVSARSRVISTMEDVYTEFSHHRTHGAVKALQVDADPSTRMRAAEQILIKIIEELFQLADNDLDRCDARTLALIMSVATVLKIMLNPKISHAHWEKLLDKCPTFVTPSAKPGVFKIKPALISKKSIIVKDHQFTLNPVFLTVHCYQCREAIWGVQPQAYFCQNCDVIVHKQCTGKLADRCYPASQHHKQKTGTLASSSRLRTASALNLQQSTSVQATIQSHQTRQPLGVGYKTPVAADYRTVSGQRGSTSVEYRNPAIASSSGQVAPVFRKPLGNLPSDTRSMGYDPTTNSKHTFAHMESVLSPSDLPPHQPPPAPGTSAAVSLNEPIRLQQQVRVQVSPTQPQVIQRLVSGVHHGEHAAKSTSSDSGIGAEMERPVSRSQSMKTKDRILNQLEEVSEQHESDAESSIAALPSTIHSAIHSVKAQDIRSVSGSSSHSIGQDEAKHMLERVQAMCEEDSDLDADVDIPPLDQIISWQVLKRIDPKLRKLQESINEFYHTERTHVRNLKVICRIFFKPIVEQKLGSREFVKLVFGNLDELLELHSGMFQRMRVVNEQWKKDPAYDGLYGKMGETIANFFNGEDGEKMQRITSAFCQDQQQGLRVLAERRQKDEQLAAFLIKAESNPLCRKFQLKDLMPVEIQRLSKFPLLLDSILRYTNESSDEFEQYTKASMGAKRLLSAVNTAKRDTENRRYLEELNKKIEMPSGNRASDNYIRKYFDIMQYRYVYDGDVIWRHSRGKSDMRLILLDHLLILLTKGADNKYYMKTPETNSVPLLWLPSVTVEEKPGDKRMFVLFYERDLRSYELQAQSITERKTWEQLLKSQIAAAKDELPHHFETDLVSLMPRLMRPGAQQPSTDENPSPATATASVEPLERVHVTTHPALVRANEIVIQQPTILEHARPVLSTRERLTRSDKIIMQALAEKHGIIAEELMAEKKLTQDEMESIAELLTGMSTIELRNRNPAELALSAIVHVNRLVDSINTRMSNKRQDSDKVGEEAERYLPYVPCYKLTAIAAPLLNHLTALSQVIKDQRQELAELRKEINKNKLEAAHQPDRSASEETLTETRIIR